MMQNFSAGLLISAIGSELFPLLQNGVPSSNEEPSNFEFYCGTMSGFVIGIVCMFAIEFVYKFKKNNKVIRNTFKFNFLIFNYLFV